MFLFITVYLHCEFQESFIDWSMFKIDYLHYFKWLPVKNQDVR